VVGLRAEKYGFCSMGHNRRHAPDQGQKSQEPYKLRHCQYLPSPQPSLNLQTRQGVVKHIFCSMSICLALSDKNRLAAGRGVGSLRGMSNARIFRCFNTSPEIIRLAVMMYRYLPPTDACA